jgi:imidazolonepropionase
MKVYRNFSQIVTLESAHQKDGRNLTEEDLSILNNASIVFDSQKILWVGPDHELPKSYKSLESHDFSQKVLIPEIIDCHTHLVFGGNREGEYTKRLNGATYQELACMGGGIQATVKKTRELSRDQLFTLACERIERMAGHGVGTIEIKSGYGLNYEKEKELCLIIDDLKKKYAPSIQIINTYMAAHAVAPEFSTPKDYLDQIVIPLMKEMATLRIIDAIDIFFEKGYFSYQDTKNLFEQALKLKIPRKGHMDEFHDNKGASLGVRYNAISVDHLLKSGPESIEALAHSSTVATLLPGTAFFLGVEQANAQAFFNSGCKVAIGSDYNPGSCHWDNVLMIALMAAPLYKMNTAQLWASITLNGAHALNLMNQGVIKKGFSPRFTIFNTTSIDTITYHWGRNFALTSS